MMLNNINRSFSTPRHVKIGDLSDTKIKLVMKLNHCTREEAINTIANHSAEWQRFKEESASGGDADPCTAENLPTGTIEVVVY